MSQTKQAVNGRPVWLHICLILRVSGCCSSSSRSQVGWDRLLDTLPLDTNRKVMRDTATLSGCGQDVPVRLPSDWLVLPSHLSPLVFFNKEEMMEGQKDGRQGGKTILQCQLCCPRPTITAATSGTLLIFCHCETADVAGGHQPEEKTAVRLLVEMNSEQRQEGRRRRERGRDVAGSVRLL